MTTTITKTACVCDVCKEETYHNPCLGCGKDFCYDCSQSHATQYNHGVYVSGSGDGVYCRECEPKMAAANDPKLMAYRRIKALREEGKAWGDNFQLRVKTAEAELAAIK